VTIEPAPIWGPVHQSLTDEGWYGANLRDQWL